MVSGRCPLGLLVSICVQPFWELVYGHSMCVCVCVCACVCASVCVYKTASVRTCVFAHVNG